MDVLPPARPLLTGRAMIESARWHEDRLWFADWGTGEVVAVDLAGHAEVTRKGRTGWGGRSRGCPTGACSPRAGRSPAASPTVAS